MNELAIRSGRAIADTAADREAWLAERRDGIGASEAAAVLGVSPYATPLEVYLRKLDQMPPPEETAAMRRGKRMEPVILADYCDATGAEILNREVFLRSPDHAWQLATIDAVARLPFDATTEIERIVECKLVECKLVGWRNAHEWGEAGTDEIPEHYLCQVQHQMAVTGWPSVDVAALIGGSDFRVYTVVRDDAIIARLTEIEAEFWDRVQRRDPPPATAPADAQFMRWLYPEPSGFVILGPEGTRAAADFKHEGELIRELEGIRATSKARLLEAMGTAGEAELPDGTRITRKIVEVKEQQVTRKAYSFVDLRFRAPKERKES